MTSSRSYTLYPLLFVFTLLPVIALPYGILMSSIMPLLIVLLALYMQDFRQSVPVFLRSLLVAVLATGWAMLSSFWSITPNVSFITASRMCILLACSIWILRLLRKQQQFPARLAEVFFYGFCVALVALCSEVLPGGGVLTAVAQHFGFNTDDLLHRDINRGLCALVIFAWPALIAAHHVAGKKGVLAISVALLAGIFAMHSLSAKLGLIVGLAAFYAAYWGRGRIAEIITYGAALLLLSWPLVFYQGEGVIRQYAYEHVPESSQHRIEIWHFAMGKWEEKPWQGWGTDTSRAMPGGEVEVKPNWTSMPMHPHNVAVQLLLENGVIGYGLAVIAVFLAIRAALQASKYERLGLAATAACVTSFLAISFSAFNLWQVWWMCTPLMAGICITIFLKATIVPITNHKKL